MKPVAVLIGDDTADTEEQTFDWVASTVVWKGSGFGKLDDLKAGQTVLFNLTWATLYGPGRITDL